ncbi:MAG: hypothetical protein V1913_15505 [Fibrobacterota bacterium]
MINLWTLLIGMALVLIPAAESWAKTVQAEGSGFNHEQAVQNALRAAVEKGVGLYVQSETMVKNYQLLADNIYSRTNGFVKHFEILPASETIAYGLVTLSVTADVEADSLRAGLQAIQLLYQNASKPGILVQMTDRDNRGVLPQQTSNALIEKALLEKGFRVMDPGRNLLPIGLENALADSQATAYGCRLGADILILGSSQISAPEEKLLYGVPFHKYVCQTNLRAIRTDIGRVVAVASQNASKSAQNNDEAARTALRLSGVSAADTIIEKLTRLWNDEAYNTRDIQLTLSNLNEQQLSGIETELMAIPGVKGVLLRYYEKERAILDVAFTGYVQGLRAGIAQRLPVVIIGLSANSLVCRFGTKATAADTGALRLRPAPDPFEILKTDFSDLFASRCKYYVSHPAGALTLRNNAGQPLDDVRISVFIPGYTALESQTRLDSLPAKHTEKADFTLTLDEKALSAISGNIKAQAQITLSYRTPKGVAEKRITKPVTLYDKNALAWKEKESIGAFINPKQKDVRRFAQEAAGKLAADTTEKTEKSLYNAMAVFNALSLLGIRYIKDPNDAPNKGVDFIQFPLETLKEKSGDCDDLSVLMASLLESIVI